MKPQDALTRVIEHREIFHDEMISLMRQIMAGEVSPVMIAALIGIKYRTPIRPRGSRRLKAASGP